LDIGVYCVQFASFVFHGERPSQILAGGHLNSDGTDESTSATLLYPGGKTATLITQGKAKYEAEAVIIGTNGVIKVSGLQVSENEPLETSQFSISHSLPQVPFRFWCPTQLITASGTETLDLPPTDQKFNYANSVGLLYEAQEVRKCLQKGKAVITRKSIKAFFFIYKLIKNYNDLA